MTKVTYEQAYADHEYLWSTYGSAADMTGGYVDQQDLSLMLRNPTKAQARKCLISQIEYWFQMGTDTDRDAPRAAYINDALVREIHERYNIS